MLTAGQREAFLVIKVRANQQLFAQQPSYRYLNQFGFMHLLDCQLIDFTLARRQGSSKFDFYILKPLPFCQTDISLPALSRHHHGHGPKLYSSSSAPLGNYGYKTSSEQQLAVNARAIVLNFIVYKPWDLSWTFIDKLFNQRVRRIKFASHCHTLHLWCGASFATITFSNISDDRVHRYLAVSSSRDRKY